MGQLTYSPGIWNEFQESCIIEEYRSFIKLEISAGEEAEVSWLSLS